MEKSESKKFFGKDGGFRMYEIVKGNVSSSRPYIIAHTIVVASTMYKRPVGKAIGKATWTPL